MLAEKMKRAEEVFWTNPRYLPFEEAAANCPFSLEEMRDADSRLLRFSSYIKTAFPETESTDGIIESELKEIPSMKTALEKFGNVNINGRLFLKMDSHLPVAGSVKARGGVYEILKFAEDIALGKGMITPDDDYSVFAGEELRKVFSEYSVAVGSTGNLGLSIGIISAKLGFKVTVHMSSDAKKWKKDMLRSYGVKVIEYDSDYSEAVKQGRLLAEKDSKCHFVDDENSETLFFGYSTAALRLKKQLDEKGLTPDKTSPLFVYLPCGVGGAPGGIAFGLKQVFGDNVHCFFAEPVNAPCMLLGLSTGLHNKISVTDIGISGNTAADGLAVGRASGFAGKIIEPFLAGCYTLTDERMCELLKLLNKTENIRLEPSALAGMWGSVNVSSDEKYRVLAENEKAVHIVWATGGGMVPEEEMKKYLC